MWRSEDASPPLQNFLIEKEASRTIFIMDDNKKIRDELGK